MEGYFKKEKMKEVLLEEFCREVQVLLTDKLFREVSLSTERKESVRGTIIGMVGRALGETLEEIEVPSQWRRLLKRKDCPEYMKEIQTYNIIAYYHKLSLPEEEHYITIQKR